MPGLYSRGTFIVNAKNRVMTSKIMKSAAKLKKSNLTGLLAGGRLSPQAYGSSFILLLGALTDKHPPRR